MDQNRQMNVLDRLNQRFYIIVEAFILKFVSPQKVTPFFKGLFRLPVWFYRHGMGFFFENSMLLLTTTGRTSGLPRYHCLSYGFDRQRGVYSVMAGWGQRSDWVANLRADPHVIIQAGRRIVACLARFVPVDKAVLQFQDILAINPYIKGTLERWTGEPFDGSPDSIQRVVAKLPIIEFVPLNGAPN